MSDASGNATYFNPFDPNFRINPYPTYRRILEEQPAGESPLGIFVFARYADCLAILRDQRFSSDFRKADGFEPPEGYGSERELDENRPFLFLDPPDHKRLRGLVSKAFTPKTIEGLKPRIQEVVDELIDDAEGGNEADLIEVLAYPLPVIVISEMLGVPSEDHDQFKQWSDELARSLDPEFTVSEEQLQRRMDAAKSFRSYFAGLIEERRREPANDLLTALIAAEDEGDKLTEDELLTTCILILVAGHETTVNLIANGALALLKNRDQFELLSDSPELIKTAVDELLRYDPPVQFTGRVALEDVDVAGLTVPKGRAAFALLAASNRDPAQFSDPERLDIRRDPNNHLSFGMGIHHCLGAPLARAEGQIAIGTLVRRLPKLELATDQLEYKENVVLRGLASLPVTF